MDVLLSIVRSSLPTRRDLLPWALIFSAYLITAKLGSYFYFAGTSPALIWPPVGIALAGLYLKGYRMWSAVALAALAAGVSDGSSIALLAGSTIGNTLQPLAGAWLFRRLDFHPTIGRLRDTLAFIGMAFILTMIAPTFLVALLSLFETLSGDPYELWRIVWSGGVLSVLILTPLIVGWATDRSTLLHRMGERLSAFGLLATIAYLIFWTPYSEVAGISLAYLLLVPLFWIGLRFRPRSLALALTVASTIAFTGIFATVDNATLLGARLFQTMLFLETLAVIFYIFASVVEERRTAAAELQRHIMQLQKALDRIRHQDRAKSEFLAILAHELRNPLAPVLSTLELFKLKRAKAKDEITLLDGAEERLHAMGRLLDDLLDVSRISEQRLKLQREPVELHAIVERSAATARHLMEKYKHTLTIDMAGPAIWLYADPLRIEQVIVNLLTNAAKYTEPGGIITLNCFTEGTVAIVRIQDNGIGVAPDMVERIFEPFLQIPSKKGVSGVGVGLSLARQLVALHDGAIVAHSKGAGLGSTFTVTLPTMSAPTKVETAAPPTPPQRVTEDTHVLIVDDNEAAAEALARLLSFRNYKTSIAFSGEDAFALVRAEQPDAVLLDIGLPDMDGYELARKIRTALPSVRLIALTGYGQADDVEKAKKAGCDDHLTKPVGFKDIERALRGAGHSS
jgi:signal transduction histidine kinase